MSNTEELRANMAVKSIGSNRVGGYGLLWGSEDMRDLYGEFFDKNDTKDIFSIFKALGMLPGLYAHGMDKGMRSRVTGVIDTMKADNRGIWVEEQLRLSEEYMNELGELLEKEKLFWSSGALPGGYETDLITGKIKRWPIMEFSKTVSPAEWRMVYTPIQEIKSHFLTVGLDLATVFRTTKEWKAGGSRDLEVIDRDSWDGDAARDRIFGDGEEIDISRAKMGHLVYDDSAPELRGSYKLPFADVVDGELKAISSGLTAAAQRLPQTDIPESVRDSAQRILDSYDNDTEGEENSRSVDIKIAKLNLIAIEHGIIIPGEGRE